MLANLIKKPELPLLTSLLVFILLCGQGCKDNTRLDVNVDDISIQLGLRRFEKDIYSIEKNNIPAGVQALQASYPQFFPFYAKELMGWEEQDYINNISIFLNDHEHRKLFDTINQVFGDMEESREIIEEGFKHFAWHFPQRNIPVIITMITEFAYPTATTEDILAISLERFLGQDYPYYSDPNFNIPQYILRRMNKEHLPVAAMNAWFDQQFGELRHKGRLLDKMIAEGKKMYFMKAMYPDMEDTLVTGWTKEQLDWLKENEYQMWTYYIEKNLLYDTDVISYLPLINDAPFTSAPGVPPESAPRIGVFTGLQIVEKYMEAHQEVNLITLFADLDSDKILKESGYRP